MKYLLSVLLVLLAIVVIMMFSAHNDQTVTFNYLVGQQDYRLSTLLALAFMTGFLFCWLVCALFYLRLHIQHRSLVRQHKRLNQQIDKNHTTTHNTHVLPKQRD